MGNGSARIVAVMRAAAPALGAAAMLLGAASALAAGTSAGRSHGSAPAQPQLLVDTGGPRGLSVPLAPFAAGDVQQRTVSLRANGHAPIAAAGLTVDASGAGPALGRRGFDLRVDRCSLAWSATPGAGLRCTGQTHEVLGWSGAQGRLTTTAVGPIDAGATAFLRITVRLSPDAAADQEGRSLQLLYRFTVV